MGNPLRVLDEFRRKLSSTIFTKYLAATSGIIILTFILFGLVCAGIMTGRWQSESQQQLSDNLQGVADRASRYVTPVIDDSIGATGDYQFSNSAISSVRTTMSMLGASINADIFMIDTQGHVFLCSEDDPMAESSAVGCSHREAYDPESAVEMLTTALLSETGDYRYVGKVFGDETSIVVGVPIITQDENERDIAVGLVIGAASAYNVTSFRKDVNNIIFLSIIIASLISVISVYIITYKQVKPLRQMAVAVRKYAAGDFSVRVPVETTDEVGQLAAGFNNMADSLSEVENSRRSFIANISHELKTPMTTISGFVDGILDGTIPPDKHNHYLSTVSSETKRLSRLVRSMLDLSRIDSGELKLNKSRFDLAKSVFETLLTFEQRIEEKNIEVYGLENLKSLVVRGDPDLLHQVIYNLLDNAVKFTNVGGKLNIRIYHQDRNAFVCIGNTGIGIPSDELPRLFERFYKTDKSRSHDKTGVGLGLYIVKTILTLHDGGIEARSSDSGYCEFEFHIPINSK